MTFKDINVHVYSLVFGRREFGPILIDRLKGIRRPGTNRLSAGGYVALSFLGGSLTMNNTELGYNFDDTSDIESGMSYASFQVRDPARHATRRRHLRRRPVKCILFSEMIVQNGIHLSISTGMKPCHVCAAADVVDCGDCRLQR